MHHHNRYIAYLHKISAAGTWGFLLYGDDVVNGPRDTHGHKEAPLPYYPSGGSSYTEAPGYVGASLHVAAMPLGAGPPGPRVFNKHGDIISGSARGMHPDKQAEEDIMVGGHDAIQINRRRRGVKPMFHGPEIRSWFLWT